MNLDKNFDDINHAEHYPAAGQHCLADFYDADFLDDQDFIEQSLISAAQSCGATIIGKNFHKFGGGGGVTGVLLLAESHISIHTWPEQNYAAIDIFMCGKCDVENAVAKLELCFKPGRTETQIIARGMSDGL